MASVVAQINKILGDFSHQLIPSDDYIDRGKEVANKLFQVLQHKSKFAVARRYISGSSGKKTSIFDSDLDLVLFINKIDLPDIEDVLDDFENILLLAENLPKLNVASIRRTRFSVQFRYDIFDVDMLPAINFIEQPKQSPVAQQASAVLRKIKENPKKAYHYSSGLAEAQLEFMKRQSSFIHELVRICKLWNKSLLIDGYISGRSTLIELIAVYAGQREEEDRDGGGNASLLNAFQTFLQQIEKFPELEIEFDFDPLKPYETMNQLMRGSQFHHDLKRSFYVIEPVNPFNNIARGVKEGQMKLFQKYASETLRRLSTYISASSCAQIALDGIFQPQPKVIPYISEDQKKLFQTASFLVSACVEEGPSCPSMVIRNEDKFKNRDMQGTLKYFQDFFSVVAQGFVSSAPCNSTKSASPIRDELQERMQRCVDVNVKGGEPREWVAATEKHEDHEVTFSIPCSVKIGNTEHKFCARISLKSA